MKTLACFNIGLVVAAILLWGCNQSSGTEKNDSENEEAAQTDRATDADDSAIADTTTRGNSADSDTDSESVTETATEGNDTADSDTGADTGSESVTETATGGNDTADSDTGSESVTETAPDTDSNTHANIETDPDTGTDTATDTETSADTATGTETSSDTGADTGTDSATERETEEESCYPSSTSCVDGNAARVNTPVSVQYSELVIDSLEGYGDRVIASLEEYTAFVESTQNSYPELDDIDWESQQLVLVNQTLEGVLLEDQPAVSYRFSAVDGGLWLDVYVHDFTWCDICDCALWVNKVLVVEKSQGLVTDFFHYENPPCTPEPPQLP
ncbi:MAG: hypothetical protein JXX14_18590 [Deltaproteobacteria bacterium]|nr:hypothetical protein [Deltaproteobacteria bacterium]